MNSIIHSYPQLRGWCVHSGAAVLPPQTDQHLRVSPHPIQISRCPIDVYDHRDGDHGAISGYRSALTRPRLTGMRTVLSGKYEGVNGITI